MASIEGKNRYAAAGEFVIVVAIEQPIGGIGARTADGERERTTSGHFAARATVKEAAGTGFLCGAGRKGGELDKVAAVERQIGDLLGGDDLAQGRISGLNSDSRGGDFHALLHIGGRKGEIDFALFVNLEADIFHFAGLKPGECGTHGVGGYSQQGNNIMAAGIGNSVTYGTCVLAGDGDFCTRNGTARGVGYRSRDGSGRLTEK